LIREEFSDEELEAYLDEELDAERATRIEKSARENSELLKRLSHINARRDAGVHSLGEIWRRNQIGVPTREQLSQYLDEKLDKDFSDYIKFRVEILRCRITMANLDDLRRRRKDSKEQSTDRRKKIFQRSKKLLDE
jgi:hypothetical protein